MEKAQQIGKPNKMTSPTKELLATHKLNTCPEKTREYSRFFHVYIVVIIPFLPLRKPRIFDALLDYL